MEYAKLLNQVEVLSDLLTEPLDLEVALDKALKYILNAVGRSGGILMIQLPNQEKPQFLLSYNISQHWSALIKDENSTLIKLAQQTATSGKIINQNRSLELGLSIPIQAGTEGLGALLINGPACTPNEIETLEYFSRAVGRYVQADLYQRKSPLRNQEIAALQLISALSNTKLTPDELQARITRSLCRILDAESCSLVVLDEGKHRNAFKKTFGGNSRWVHQTHQNLKQGIIAECIKTTRPICVQDIRTDPLYHDEFDGITNLNIQSALCVPLISNEIVQGAVVVYNKQNGVFDTYDQKMLVAMTNLLTYAMNDINLVQQLRVTSAELEVNRWQLLRSRNTLRALFDSIPLSFYIIDQKYELVAINLSRSQRLGDNPSNMVGRLCYKALYNRDDPCPGCKVSETLFGGKSTHRVERNFLENAEIIEWEISTYPIKDENGQVTQAIHLEQDMTEKRQLENQVMQSEKLAVVGQLAAGIAHEINNPLTAIVANAQLLKVHMNGNDENLEALDLIELAGNRASQVVRNLLNLARKDQYEFVRTDVNESINSALCLVQHELNSNSVTLATCLEENLPLVKLSQEHIQGVWTNLVLNGIDAQKEQGSGEIAIETTLEKKNVIITIADKGSGIAPENSKRIFEPFYTTKEAGSGTGLGLTICQKIVKHHGGQIQVYSKLGEGTKFTISLPI